jgi:hypothetical protein
MKVTRYIVIGAALFGARFSFADETDLSDPVWSDDGAYAYVEDLPADWVEAPLLPYCPDDPVDPIGPVDPVDAFDPCDPFDPPVFIDPPPPVYDEA